MAFHVHGCVTLLLETRISKIDVGKTGKLNPVASSVQANTVTTVQTVGQPATCMDGKYYWCA